MTNFWIPPVAGGVVGALVVWALAGVRVVLPAQAAGSCEGLMSLKLPSATITLAKVDVADGVVKIGTGPSASRCAS